VRLLPEYDNVLLAHADRSRFAAAEDPSILYPAGQLGRGHVLVDGCLRGSWRVADGRLDVLHLALTRAELDETVAEATRLAAFLYPDDPPAVTATAV
jgi:hypothetical protein